MASRPAADPEQQVSGPHDTDELKAHDYLRQFGARLIDNGYQVVPIRAGSKSPGFDGWEKSRASKDQLNEWINHGFSKAGVGILTTHTPAVDIDVRDERVAMLMDAYVREHLGGTLVRIGKAPKRLFVFRCDTPFRKMRSTVRKDEWLEKQQIEVLGQGQQFVAYHVHPETGLPYTWPDEFCNPLDVRASDLPTLTEEQIEGLIAYFEEVADAEGWEVAKASRSRAKAVDRDNPFAEDTAPVDLPAEEIRARLMMVPNADDYDTWFQVGMALYHQFDGEDAGREMWDEWSETADNYDRHQVIEKWDTFGIEGKKRAPVTARYILKLAAEGMAKTAAEVGDKLRTAFVTAKDVMEWDAAAKETRLAEVDAMTRSSIAEIAREARNRITNTKVTLIAVKKALAYTPAAPTGKDVPKWARDWVYDTSDDRYFNTKAKFAVTQQGYDALFDRDAITKADVLEGKSSPSSTAHSLALNFYKIKAVQGRRYEPGQDPIFTSVEGTFANIYAEHEIPKEPEKKLPLDVQNVKRVKAHIAHLLTDPREQRMFLDWLSWIVQNPGQHVNYAILLQGTEGDGKSFFANMMREVMGMSNVTMLNAHIFENDFTDWTVGQCLACVEEVRIVKAHNKFEVINRIKPYITNEIIEVHPKGKPIYNARNTTSYLLFSNHKDALPLDDDGRRYMVLFSQWQRKVDIQAFKDENPDYYVRLYASIKESAGAIREWLLNHEQDSTFQPMGDAPETDARKYMVKQAKPEFIQVLDEIIAEGDCLFADQNLIDVTNLPEVFAERSVDWPAPKTMTAMLQRDGYEELTRIRLDEGARAVFWSKCPERFRSKSVGAWDVDPTKIRAYRKKRQDDLDDEL